MSSVCCSYRHQNLQIPLVKKFLSLFLNLELPFIPALKGNMCLGALSVVIYFYFCWGLVTMVLQLVGGWTFSSFYISLSFNEFVSQGYG